MAARRRIAALLALLLAAILTARVASAAAPATPATTRPAPVAAPAQPPADWWNKDWPYRVRLSAPKSGADLVHATVNLAGRTTNDGHDLRLIDAAGQQVPFAILHHDPSLSTLLAIKVAADQPFTGDLYYGNQHAPPFTSRKPSLNSPLWEPKRGLLLTVYRKSANVMPKTLVEKELIRASTQEGALYRSAVSDGSNPVGQSDNYISVYEGYLNIEKAGEYSFCSASADGSWIVVNGRTILEWPGPHDWSGAARGQKHGTIALEKGTARIQYYQEAGGGPQMAFMGWQPPGQDHFTSIPPERWLDIRTASASEYTARDKPIMALAAVTLHDTYWVRDSDAQQTALLEFADQSASRAGKITQRHWTFGDGLEGGSAKAEHVYFRLGRPEITLTVTDDKGNSDTATCAVPVYLVDVEGRTVALGSADEHASLAGGYDTDKLKADDLAGYADFWLGLERWPQAVRAVDAFIRRFPDIVPTGRLAAAGAAAAMQPLAFDPQRAERWFALAITRSITAQEKIDLKLRRAENLAWNLNDGKTARALFGEVQQAAMELPAPARKQATRHSLIGLGDVFLLTGELEKARQQYQRAQDVPMRRKPDQPEELAKLGGYPYAVDDLIGRREYEYALVLLDQWEDEFPVQKLDGNSFFLRGKTLYLQKPGEPALHFLDLAERIDPKAAHVPDALWLHAECLKDLGRFDQALACYARIRSDFTTSEYFARAAERITFCTGKLKPAGPPARTPGK